MKFIRPLAACATLLLLACSHAPESPNAAAQPADDTTFADGDWHPGVALRRVGDAFGEVIERIVVTPNGGVAAIRRSYRAADDLNGLSTLETFDASGRVLASAPAPQTVIVIDIVVHPSGEFTVVEVHDENLVRPQLWLRRLGADLRTLRETPLRDQPSAHELLMYYFDRQPDGTSVIGKVEPMAASSDGIVHVDPPAWLERHLLLAARGEEAILSALGYGTKIYVLAANLDVLWSRQVMPSTSSTTTLFGMDALTVDGAGRIGVALSVDQEVIQAYERHFARDDIAWSGPFYQTMVTRIAADGQMPTMRLFSHGDADAQPIVAGVALRDDEVTLCGSVHMKNKFQEPNHTMEWDLSWVRGPLSGGPVTSQIIDVKRDDYTIDCKVDANGGVLFAGTNDFVQVDTNSWVEFGQGFLYGVDATGRETSRVALRGPRHTQVQAFARSEGGHVFFAGSFDGPITHTPTTEWNKKAMLGIWH